MDKLTNEMIKDLANEMGLEPALLKAVQLVEAGGRDGFLPDGRPQILFEGHIMYKELRAKFGIDKAKEGFKKYPEVIYPKWDKTKYLGGGLEYRRLEKAESVDSECAMKSASWGIFQIMGQNYKLCGCKDVFEFVDKMRESHASQLRLGYHFMYNSGLIKPLKEPDWEKFARGYNGPGQVEYYSQKLKNGYENFKDKI
jgi:hypothetical protein